MALHRASRLPIASTALVCIALLTACGESPEPEASRPAKSLDFAGVYRVTGTTIELESGAERHVKGLAILKQDGDSYTTNFDLETGFTDSRLGEGENLSVEIIGSGSGRVEGDVLEGTARTQLIQAMVPGVDSRFPFLPRRIGPRIESTTHTRMLSDDAIEVEIETHPAEGEAYAVTRTTVRGVRVSDADELRELPAVGAGPPGGRR